MQNKRYSFKIYTSSGALPDGWDSIAASNIFLQSNYLAVLETASPDNMECHFIALFNNGNVCGVAIAQYIDLSYINTFVKEKKSFLLKDYLLKRFSSKILILGNNTLTGQNAYVLSDEIPETTALQLFEQALIALKKSYKEKKVYINLISIKDFNVKEMPDYLGAGLSRYYKFCTQPNMIFSIQPHWNSLEDYIADMNTKYRTQYNRARKKANGIVKRQMEIDDIKAHEDCIRRLYLTVAGNASFNTFHLPKAHFAVYKQKLRDNFLFYGYFINNRLIGFNTLIKNGNDMDTYFLGYDAAIQKEKLLYLNMLYDILGYAIKNSFKQVIFARSAMEIKSSVGAKAEDVYGLIKHTNPILNLFIGRLFRYFDPKIEWKERNPFKV